jgi:hypothetical protein
LIYQYVCSLTSLYIWIFIELKWSSLCNSILLHHYWICCRSTCNKTVLLSMSCLLSCVMSTLLNSFLSWVHIIVLRALVQNCLWHLRLSRSICVTGALKRVSQLRCVDAGRAIRRSRSLVHTSMAQTIGWMVWLSLVDVIVINHHWSESVLISCLRSWLLMVICLLCIIDIDATWLFTMITLHLHVLKGIRILGRLKKLLMVVSWLTLGLVVTVVSSSWFTGFLGCSSWVSSWIGSWLANHETVLGYSLHQLVASDYLSSILFSHLNLL